MTKEKTSVPWLLLRLGGLACLIIAAVLVSQRLAEALEMRLMPHNEEMMHKIIILSLLAYVVTMSLPFLPGAEIGLALLTAFGASMVGAVYLATVFALTLAFLIGYLVPGQITARWLQAVGLTRAAQFAQRMGDAPPGKVVEHLMNKSENPLLPKLIRYRYLALALAINMPGNIVIGGGGGIALAAGLSRTFNPVVFILTVAVAVLPVPLAFLLGGT